MVRAFLTGKSPLFQFTFSTIKQNETGQKKKESNRVYRLKVMKNKNENESGQTILNSKWMCWWRRVCVCELCLFVGCRQERNKNECQCVYSIDSCTLRVFQFVCFLLCFVEIEANENNIKTQRSIFAHGIPYEYRVHTHAILSRLASKTSERAREKSK